MLFEGSAEKVLFRWKSAKYFVSLLSFIGAIILIPYIKDFISPYLVSYAWSVLPVTYLVAWLAMIFVLPEVLYLIIGLFIK